MLVNRVGNAVFVRNERQRELQKLLTKQVKQTLSEKEQWWICHGEYIEQQWEIIFSLMKEAHPIQIELGRNLKSNIIKDVCSTSFVCLKALCFGKNNIANIEMISHINAPLLQWLSFQQNFITSLRPLKKAFLPNLKVINLKFNKLNKINLSDFNAPKLSKICLQLCCQEPKQGEIVNWAFKLQTKKLHILRCKNYSRIANSLIQKQLTQKYPCLLYKKYNPMQQNSQSQSDH